MIPPGWWRSRHETYHHVGREFCGRNQEGIEGMQRFQACAGRRTRNSVIDSQPLGLTSA